MRYEPNRAFRPEFQATPGYQAALAFITAGVKEAIVTAALPFRATGYFINHLGIRGKDRVVSRDNFTHLIEFGSVNNPAYAPIRRGVREAGLRFDNAREPT